MKKTKSALLNNPSFPGIWAMLSIAALTATLAAGGLAFSRTAHASSPQPAITITSDDFDGAYTLTISQDSQGAIQEFTYQSDDGPKTVTLAAIEQGFQPLSEEDGHTVVYLSADPGFNAQRGGYLELKFITNVLTGGYKDFRILADIQGGDIVLRSDPDLSDSHSDKNKYTDVFDQLFFKKAMFGISSITPSES